LQQCVRGTDHFKIGHADRIRHGAEVVAPNRAVRYVQRLPVIIGAAGLRRYRAQVSRSGEPAV
jgi:hypothetical protein